MADFEDKSSYSITVVATSADADAQATDPRDSTYARVDVTIKVVDGEDEGKVTLSAREPQDGSSVLATLDDPDGGETAVEWQWYRGGDDEDTARYSGAELEHDPEEYVLNNADALTTDGNNDRYLG